MALNVNSFRSRLVGDGARPSLFRIKVYAPNWVGLDSENFSFLANAGSLPSSPLGERIISYMGQDIKLAGDRTFSDFDIQVINDENFSIRDAFERWSNGISQYTRESNVRVDGASADPNSYVGKIIVEQLGKDKETAIKKYELMNAWPALISPIQIAWALRDEVEEFYVSFRYDYFISENSTT